MLMGWSRPDSEQSEPIFTTVARPGSAWNGPVPVLRSGSEKQRGTSSVFPHPPVHLGLTG